MWVMEVSAINGTVNTVPNPDLVEDSCLELWPSKCSVYLTNWHTLGAVILHSLAKDLIVVHAKGDKVHLYGRNYPCRILEPELSLRETTDLVHVSLCTFLNALPE
jgi:hypothetical protein